MFVCVKYGVCEIQFFDPIYKSKEMYTPVEFPYHIINIMGKRTTNGNTREEVVIYEDDHFKHVYDEFVSIYGTRLFEMYQGLQVLKQVNKGSYGRIYMVIVDNRLYAMKIEEHVYYDEKKFRDKIKQEFNVQRFCHKHMCAPKPKEYGFFKYGRREYSYIIMRYLVFYNDTIGDILSNSLVISESFVQLLYNKLSYILHQLQKYNVTHGDLHFNNLYIYTSEPTDIEYMNSDNTEICVLDFGFGSLDKSRLKLELLTLYRNTYIQNIKHKETIRIIIREIASDFGIDMPQTLGELNVQFNEEILK